MKKINILFTLCGLILITAIFVLSGYSDPNIPPEGKTADYTINGGFCVEDDVLRWDLEQINVPETWELVSGGDEILTAVIDTGIDQKHPCLKDKVVERINFSDSEGIDTARGHGTHIAGLIAATFEDQDNLNGIAYNSKLLDVQVADNDGSTDAEKVAKGIIWSVNRGAKIINISIVIRDPYPMLEYAVNYAKENDCLIIAAAGNSGCADSVYPASYPGVISVAATDRDDRIAGWSNHGDWVDVAAPGVDIYSILPGDGYGGKNGTSYSTALVSGQAALLYGIAADTDDDNMLRDEVENLILSFSDDLSLQELPGKRVNVFRSVNIAAILSAIFSS
jgi:thermitase